MSEAMPRPRPPHLHRERNRHGEIVWYVRIGKGSRTRIRAEYGTPAFEEAYRAAIAGERPKWRSKASAGTLAWLVDRYRETAAWGALSAATRRQRENILKHVIATAGAQPFGQITRATILAGKDRRKDRPAAARHFLDTMRGLFAWAVEAEMIATDPTVGVKAPAKTGDGHHTWTDDECAAYEARWPRGTRQRLAYDVLLYTGLRRGDAVTLGRQHVRNGVATIKTEKTGEVVSIAILPPLVASIEAGPTGDLAFIVGENGKPLTKESFGNFFREWCKAAGVPGSAHGLRKALATRLANNGATVAQLEALFGWRGGGMASLYTRKADRTKLAKEASAKLFGEQPSNIYSLTIETGAGMSDKTKGISNA